MDFFHLNLKDKKLIIFHSNGWEFTFVVTIKWSQSDTFWKYIYSKWELLMHLVYNYVEQNWMFYLKLINTYDLSKWNT